MFGRGGRFNLSFKIIWREVIFIAAVFCLSASYVQAGQPSRLSDNFIGSTFKTLAKAFTATCDLEKIKRNNLVKLTKMSEEKFHRRYSAAYAVFKDCPEFKSRYGFTEGISQEEVISKIKRLDKSMIYKMIDDVPNVVIAGEFKQYLQKKSAELRNSDLMIQINQLWDRVTKNASGG